MSKQNAKKIILGFVAAIAVAAVVWTVLPSGLDKQVIEQQLKYFAERVTQETARKGRDITFQYDGVDIRGGFWNRHAVVVNPRFDGHEGLTAVSIGTEEMTIVPESKDLSTFTFAFPRPVTVHEAARKAVEVRFDASPSFTVRREEKDGAVISHSESLLPSTIELFRYTEEEPAQEIRDFIVSFEANPELTSSWNDAGSTLESHADFSNLKVVNAEDSETFSVARLTFDMTNTPKVGTTRIIQYDMAVDGMVVPPEFNPYGPVDAKVSLEYVGEVPEEGISQMPLPIGKEANLKIKDFSIRTQSFGISAKGQFSTSVTDIMPVGAVSLTLEHADVILSELEKAGWLREEDKKLFGEVVLKATGKEMDGAETIVLEFKREAGGKFFVGNVSFDEILALMMLHSPGAAQPMPEGEAPAMDTPAATDAVPAMPEEAPTPEVAPEGQ